MSQPKKVMLVVSDKKPEQGKGTELQVSLVDEKLNPAKPIAARLCGGTTTCMAVMETE